MEILRILAIDHEKWINVVENMGSNKAICEDIVQDTYIKVAMMKNPRKLLYNESEVNYWYFCLMLRSTFVDYVRKMKLQASAEFVTPKDDVDMDKEEAWEKMYIMVISRINEFGRYGSVLSQMYFKTDYSLRDLSDMSEISLTSIYNSIRKYRDQLQEELGDDWEDYLNGDYDKI